MSRHLAMIAAQTTYQLRLYVRNARVVLYGALTPVMLLVLLAAISDHRHEVGYINELTAAMINLGLLGTCFTTLAASLVASRDAGVLKRLRATPLPIWVHLTGRVLATMIVVALQTAVLLGVAMVFYDADVPGAATWWGIAIGGTTLCLVGLAAAQFIPRGEAAATLLSGISLPVVLTSGIFFSADELPDWVRHLADVLPVSHIGDILVAGFTSSTPGYADLGAIAAWAALGLAVALLRFRVEPAAARRETRRRAAVV